MYQQSPNQLRHHRYRQTDKLNRRSGKSDPRSQQHNNPIRKSLDPDNIAYKTIVKEDVDKDQGNFRIPALGGYDPEEDYRQNLREMNNERPNIDINNQDIMDVQASGYDSKDIAFDAGPTSNDESNVFNDGTEDPDAAYEPAGIGKDEIKQDASNDQEQPDTEEKRADFDDDTGDAVEKPESETKPAARSGSDPDEGDWVNDGVDDIEIPAQTQQDEATDNGGNNAGGPENSQEGSPDDGGSPTNREETLDGGNDDNGKQTDSDRRTNIQDANDGATGSNDNDSTDDSEIKPQSRVYQEAGVRSGPKPTKSTKVSRKKSPSVETPSKWTKDMHKAWADESKNEWPGPPTLEE